MNSEILKLAVRTLKVLFLLLSAWLLFRGHNQPGGGFIGGLIAGSALIFEPLSDDAAISKSSERKGSIPFLTLGLAFVLISALIGFVNQGILLEGEWLRYHIRLPEQTLKAGTPLLFDMGVFFTVIGFIKLIFVSLMEEWLWN